MSSDLLGEIERDAVKTNADLPALLRKCIALGGVSGSVALREWATGELKGYGEGDALPPYRTIPAILALDGATMTYRVTGQQISPGSLPDIARDLIREEVALHGPIAELTDAIRDTRNRGDGYIDFGIPGGSTLTVLTNHHLRVKGVQFLMHGLGEFEIEIEIEIEIEQPVEVDARVGSREPREIGEWVRPYAGTDLLALAWPLRRLLGKQQRLASCLEKLS